MKRLAALTAAVILTAGCTPREVAWWSSQRDAAVARGEPCPELAPLLELAGLPDHFHVIAWRESRCNPDAVNASSGALGLTQIMPFWLEMLCPLMIACEPWQLLNPTANVAASRVVYDAQGWSAWSQTA